MLFQRFGLIGLGALALLLATSGVGVAAERPRVGLVLSGGGARGAAHVGVLRALESLRVPIDAIAGTSMGAVVGGLHAEGLSPGEIEAVLMDSAWVDAVSYTPPREDLSFRRKGDDESHFVNLRLGLSREGLVLPPGAAEGERLRLLLDRHATRAAGVERFSDLPIPFRAVATDLVTGEVVVLESGSLAAALRASMSVPTLASPVDLDGRLLVDGGLSANLPVDVVRAMGVDVVIAVDISTPLLGREEVTSVVSVVEQLSSLLTARNVQQQRATLTATDVLIEPALGDISALSFAKVPEAIQAGEAATLALRERLVSLATSEDEYRAWRERACPAAPAPPIVSFVRAETDSRLHPAALTATLRQPVGQPLDASAVEEGALDMYGLGVFEEVSWRLVKESTGHGVIVSARRRSWGPGYVQFGLGLEADTEGDSGFRLGAAYTLTELNRLGGDWRTEVQVGKDSRIATELHQPLTRGLRLFVNPMIWASREVDRLYDANDDARADHRQTEWGVSLDAGRELGNWGELRLGLRRSAGESEVILGDPSIEQGDYDAGSTFARFAFDDLDDRRFPHRGVVGFVEYEASRAGLGADRRYDRIRLSVLGAATRGRGTFVGSLRLVNTFSGQTTFPERVELGGFLNLSGLRQDQLDGDDLGLLRLVWYRRLGGSKRWPTQVGVSGELGNVWKDGDAPSIDTLMPATSLFLGYDSPLGPVFLGAGWAEQGRTALYLSLGRSF